MRKQKLWHWTLSTNHTHTHTLISFSIDLFPSAKSLAIHSFVWCCIMCLYLDFWSMLAFHTWSHPWIVIHMLRPLWIIVLLCEYAAMYACTSCIDSHHYLLLHTCTCFDHFAKKKNCMHYSESYPDLCTPLDMFVWYSPLQLATWIAFSL